MTRQLLTSLVLFFLVALYSIPSATSTPCVDSLQSQGGPIIGIISEPFESGQCITYLADKIDLDLSSGAQNGLGSCFWAYYVKWLEQAGARVAVIKYDDSQENLDTLFNSVNGILFTGGELDLSFNLSYVQTAKYLYEKAIAANQAGDYFPVWGTCQGFQLLSILTADDVSILECKAYDSEDIMLALDMTPLAPTSRMFGNNYIPSTVYDILSTQNVTVNLHNCGVNPTYFTTNKGLSEFVNLLSTNVDLKGKPFASTFEAKSMPIYATQWHPERPQYTWDITEPMNHGYNAVYSMQYMSNFFIQESKKNLHCFTDSELEDRSLVYSHDPVYIGNSRQIYYFTPAKN